MISTSLWVSGVVLLIAVVTDILFGRIPNLITLGGLVAGLAIHIAVGVIDGGAFGALRGLGVALSGAALCGIIPFIAWRRGEMGGGDVKLFAAIGALMGPGVGIDVQVITFCLSLVILLPYRLVRHGVLPLAFDNLRIGVTNLLRRRGARVAYVTWPKLPPVILAPTIGAAFVVLMASQGALR